MSARRRTNDADAFRVQFPRRRVGADQADGPRGVLHFDWMMVARRAEPVFQYETRDTLVGEPLGVNDSFMGRQAGISASGADDQGRAGGFFGWRKQRRQRGLVAVGVAGGARRAVRPQQQGFGGLLGPGEPRERKQN